MSEPDGSGTPPSTSSKPKARAVVPLPVKRELAEWDRKHLATSGLCDETIKLAQLYTEINPRSIAQLLGRSYYPRMQGAALVFPFILPGSLEPHAYRIRPTKPRLDRKGKPVKYDQAAGTDLLIYWPPRARLQGWYRDAARTLYWTEGEKKALALDELGFASVGLTGVSCWHDKAHRDATGVFRINAQVTDHVTLGARDHVIVFDADSRDNDDVMHAAQRLCGVLLATGARSVRFVCPPTTDTKGIDDYYAARGGPATVELLGATDPIEPIAPDATSTALAKLRVFADCPLPQGMRMPEGYEVQRDGTLWRAARNAKSEPVMVCFRPVLVTRYATDVHTREGRADITYRDERRWQTTTVSRAAVTDTRCMVKELSTVPITSQSAPRVVEWLDALHAANDNCIPRVEYVGRTGWVTVDGAQLFAAHRVYAPDGSDCTLTVDTLGARRRMFDCLAPRGELAQHVAALSRAFAADPVCAAMICAAVAAPLLAPLGAGNFAVHLPGDSSRGKTSKLKIAASVFGHPHSDWVANWNTTHTAVELRAATYNHLPQCYDELGAGDPTSAERLIYMLVNGGGRARGLKDLTLRELPSWHTTILSTGERELADETAATGAQVRVVQLPSAGFGELGAAQVDELRETCAEHAGSLGADLLQSLVNTDSELWAGWRADVKAITAELRGQADNPLQGRVAAHFAVLALAETILSAWGIGRADGGTMRALFAARGDRETVVGLAERSIEAVRNWVASERESWPELGFDSGGNDEAKHTTARTCHGYRRGDTLYINPLALQAFCRAERFNMREVCREWQRRGWLQTDPSSQHLTKATRLGPNMRPRLYVLDLAAAP